MGLISRVSSRTYRCCYCTYILVTMTTNFRHKTSTSNSIEPNVKSRTNYEDESKHHACNTNATTTSTKIPLNNHASSSEVPKTDHQLSSINYHHDYHHQQQHSRTQTTKNHHLTSTTSPSPPQPQPQPSSIESNTTSQHPFGFFDHPSI